MRLFAMQLHPPMNCAKVIENLTGRMSAKALVEELKLSLTRDRRTLSELNKTPARDGSDSAWLCGVRATIVSIPETNLTPRQSL